MIFVNDFIEDVFSLLDANGNHVSGVAANITVDVVDPWHNVTNPVVAEIAPPGGLYFVDWQALTEGTYTAKWVCTSPIAETSHRFIVRNAQDVIADQVWDELFAAHGAAGSFGKLVQDILAAIAALNDLSMADVQTAMTAQGYTAGRAPNLDNLDAAISVVIAAIGALNNLSQADVQAAMTAQGYTAVRALLLDNLDSAISGVPAAVDAVLSAIHGAGSWETADLCDYHTQPC